MTSMARDVHDLGHDGKAVLLLCHAQEDEPVLFQALECVRRCPGLEGASAEHVGAAVLYGRGHVEDLFRGIPLHRALQ